MAKKRQSKTVSIEEGLTKAVHRAHRKAKEEKSQGWKSLSVIAVIAIVLAFYGLTQHVEHLEGTTSSSTSPSSQKLASSSSSTQSKTNFPKSLVAEKSKFHPSISLGDYEKLRLAPKTENGLNYKGAMTLEEVIKRLGKPSDAYYHSNDNYLCIDYDYHDYDIYNNSSHVSLEFEKHDGTYYLTRKDGGDLTDTRYPTNDDSTYTDDWLGNTKKIVVGNEITGEGGSTYEEVIALVGEPEKAIFSGNSSSYHPDSPMSLSLTYRKSKNDNESIFVDITLEQQKDGHYRVSAAKTS